MAVIVCTLLNDEARKQLAIVGSDAIRLHLSRLMVRDSRDDTVIFPLREDLFVNRLVCEAWLEEVHRREVRWIKAGTIAAAAAAVFAALGFAVALIPLFGKHGP